MGNQGKLQGNDLTGSIEVIPETDLVARARVLSRALALLSMAFPLSSVIGWAFGFLAVMPMMAVNTMVALLLSAVAVYCSQQNLQSRSRRLMVMFLGCAIALLGLLTLSEYAFQQDIGINELFYDPASTDQLIPGRSSPQVAFNLLLLGIAVILLNLPQASVYAAQTLALFIGASALVRTTTYLFDPNQLLGFPTFAPLMGVAIITSAAFVLLAISILFSRPAEGLMTLLTSTTRSGLLARRIVLCAVVAPPLLATLTSIGASAGLYDVVVQTNLFIILFVGLILQITWKAARQAQMEELRAAAAHQIEKKLEETLRIAEARSSGIISVSADAIVSVDEKQRITLFNEGAVHMFGYTEQEILGQSLDILIPEDVRAAHRLHIEHFGKSQETSRKMGGRSAQVRGRRKNGETFPADAAISRFDVNGRRICTVAIRDITEQKRLEYEQKFLADLGAALALTLDYATMLHNIMRVAVVDMAELCAVYLIEEDGRVHPSQIVTRAPGETAVLESIRDAQALVHSVLESKRSLLIGDISVGSASSGTQSRQDLGVLGSAGVRSLIIAPLIAHGKLFGAISLMNTAASNVYCREDLHLAEELAQRSAMAIQNARLHREAQRAKLITDNVPAMVAYWDRYERCLFANRAYMDWFELNPDDLFKRTIRELRGPELYEKNLPRIKAALAGERQDFERDVEQKSSGLLRHTQVTYIPDVLGGEVLGFFVLATDVTDLKEAQLQAMSEKEKAQAATKTREDVLAIVSHDLRNPLSIISNGSELLKHAQTLDQLHDNANRIDRSARLIQRLIDDLLDFGRIRAGTFSVRKTEDSPVEIMLSAADGMRPIAEANGQLFYIDVPQNLPKVICDGDRVAQVIANLLTNAMKFTPAGGKVQLAAWTDEKALVVSVSDTGPGIEEEHLGSVFDRFWQATATQHLGSGLGLSIAKGIIEAHGGRIWAESKTGQGSSFFFTLPVVFDAGNQTRAEINSQQSRATQDSGLNQ